MTVKERNEERYYRGQRILDEYLKIANDATDEGDIETAATDLLADLFHYLEGTTSTSLQDLAQTAINHVTEELEEELIHTPEKYPADKVNRLYGLFGDYCKGAFHNCLWQILVNESCTGAFYYLDSEDVVVIALPGGGYVDCLFTIQDKQKREGVLDQLNWLVFDLDKTAAAEVVRKSFSS